MLCGKPCLAFDRRLLSVLPLVLRSCGFEEQLVGVHLEDAGVCLNRLVGHAPAVFVAAHDDGIHTGVRLGSDDRLCCLLMLGARLDGSKELVALADGYRESAESWACLLRDLNKRGIRAPELAVGDGALGFWGALRDVFPETRTGPGTGSAKP